MPTRPATGSASSLTVIYDDTCAFCQRCRAWLEEQRLLVPIHFLAANSAAAQDRYGPAKNLREDLVVVADDGRAWIGPPAFVVLLWATRRYRSLSRHLANPAVAPFARRTFHAISSNRSRISAMLVEPPSCADDTCELPG